MLFATFTWRAHRKKKPSDADAEDNRALNSAFLFLLVESSLLVATQSIKSNGLLLWVSRRGRSKRLWWTLPLLIFKLQQREHFLFVNLITSFVRNRINNADKMSCFAILYFCQERKALLKKGVSNENVMKFRLAGEHVEVNQARQIIILSDNRCHSSRKLISSAQILTSFYSLLSLHNRWTVCKKGRKETERERGADRERARKTELQGEQQNKRRKKKKNLCYSLSSLCLFPPRSYPFVLCVLPIHQSSITITSFAMASQLNCICIKLISNCKEKRKVNVSSDNV